MSSKEASLQKKPITTGDQLKYKLDWCPRVQEKGLQLSFNNYTNDSFKLILFLIYEVISSGNTYTDSF